MSNGTGTLSPASSAPGAVEPVVPYKKVSRLVQQFRKESWRVSSWSFYQCAQVCTSVAVQIIGKSIIINRLVPDKIGKNIVPWVTSSWSFTISCHHLHEKGTTHDIHCSLLKFSMLMKHRKIIICYKAKLQGKLKITTWRPGEILRFNNGKR
jgi:hypothetical protein